jgi:hypothetical protein
VVLSLVTIAPPEFPVVIVVVVAAPFVIVPGFVFLVVPVVPRGNRSARATGMSSL